MRDVGKCQDQCEMVWDSVSCSPKERPKTDICPTVNTNSHPPHLENTTKGRVELLDSVTSALDSNGCHLLYADILW